MVLNIYLNLKYALYKMLYKCDHCNYCTKRLCDLRRHETRKNSCYKHLIVNNDNVIEETNVNDNVETNVNGILETTITPIDNSKNEVFVCKKCNKEFISKKGFVKHESKCNGLHPLQCPVCLKMFKSSVGKSQHKRYVKCIPVASSSVINNNNTYNDNSINTTNNNNVHIHLPCNFDKISKQDILDLVREMGQKEYIESVDENLESGTYVIPRTVDKIYFNDKFPRMQVIKKERRNDKMIKVHIGNGVWERRMSNDISKKLVRSVEDYHTPYIHYIQDKHKDERIGSVKWKQVTRPLKTLGNTMVWFDGFRGTEFERIGIQLNYPDEEDDDKKIKQSRKTLQLLLQEAIYDKSITSITNS